VGCTGYVPCREKPYFLPLGNHVGGVRERCLPRSELVWVWNVVNGLCHFCVLSAGLGGLLDDQRLSPRSTFGGGWLGGRGRRQADLYAVLGLNHDFCATAFDEGVFVRSTDPLVEERIE
jgi:hypothetical protein